ncbi:MAG TPA: alpha-amylase family glycosyl hydrolase [Polyangia bacterium]|nr:alpha-amylase family glycosyl hydrolase [Polyangia bacterium]
MVQQLLSLSLAAIFACGCADASSVDADWKTTSGQQGDWRDEVIYQLLVDRFADGDLNNNDRVVPYALGRFQGGDWQGVIDHLDYLQTLGVTALWISPVVRNLETDANFDSYHGYWQQDFEQVNPHFGDLAKLRELVQKAHAKNFKVILDIVTNHVAQLFYYDINGNGSPDENVYGAGCGEQAPADRQPCPGGAIITHITEYDPDFDPNGVRGYTSLGFSGQAPIRWLYIPAIDREPTMPGSNAGQLPLESQRLFQRDDWYHRMGRITDYSVRQQVLTGDFPGGLKDLKTENPDVRTALTAVFARWIQAADFDGFRIDTLKHVEHEFWQEFCPSLRKYCAGTMQLPDPTTGDPNAIVKPLSVPKQKFFMFGESFDGDDDLDGSYTMNQEVDAVFYFPQKFSVFDAVFKYGGPTVAIEQQFQRKQTKYAATPNTDGTGLSAQQSLVNFMDNHDVPRFLFDKPSVPALQNALSYLMTEDGIPCLYYGTEQEFAGGNDPNNRERLWDTGFDTSGGTFQFVQRLIKIRKAYSPLRRGDLAVKWSTMNVAMEQDAGMFAFERNDGGKKALVVINTSDVKQSETSAAATGGGQMMTSFPAGTQLTDVLAAAGDPTATITVGAAGALTVQVPSRGQKIYVPSTDVVELP